MAVAADRSIDIRSRREVVSGFSPMEVRAPFALRCVAVAVDYILIISVPVLGLLFDLWLGNDKTRLSDNTSWLIAFLVAVSNLLIFPCLSGQTLGMMMARLRIVAKDGTHPSIVRVLLRNTLGYLATLLTAGLGFLLGAVTPSGRTLHDYLTGTMVIYASRRQIK